MGKIKISAISEKCHVQKGFGQDGCLGSNCGDACCRYGADFDRTAFNLVFKHRELTESLTGIKLEHCFEGEWSGDRDFLGGDSIRSNVGPSGYCVFHMPEGKGCVLYKLVFNAGVSRRILPSVCRLYPLTWDRGKLSVYDERDDGDIIEPDCVCLDPDKSSVFNLLVTQKHEIDDIFDV
ncbi:MAG: hypothetical protein A2283_13955 [Lentisphaerae bacterium RIFOXYA12_FULL_48_11]|nr:MAG: hypothetical protein A2283_13955 [Lentisphaerae bacterium RIFOXYA12_FULL_48_11]